jgi:hypothetical protein
VSNDAKLQPHKFHTEDEEGKAREIYPDWSLIASNQITMISQQAAMLERHQEIINELRNLSDVEARHEVVKNQILLVETVNDLSVHIDKAREELELAVGKLSTTMMGIWQVPIAIVIILSASFLFYLKYIEEWTWLLILAVACFRYLGDSISGVAKLARGIRSGEGEKKS